MTALAAVIGTACSNGSSFAAAESFLAQTAKAAAQVTARISPTSITKDAALTVA